MPLKLLDLPASMLFNARGLAVLEKVTASALRPFTFTVEAVAPGLHADAGVVLEPGEETEVTVPLRGIAPNANVRSIRAVLHVSPLAAPPTPASTSVTVSTRSDGQSTSQSFDVSVTPRDRPSNVQVRLDQGEVFWRHSGVLDEDRYELPDFAQAANGYLDHVKTAGEQLALRFLVRSDTPGSVRLEVLEEQLDFSLLQTQTWTNPLDQTVRIDRNLDLDFGTITRLPLDPQVGAQSGLFRLLGVTLVLSGQVGPERVLGGLPVHDGVQFATVSADYTVAQSLRLKDEAGIAQAFAGTAARVTGVVAVLAPDGETELYLEIQPDHKGQPASGEPLVRSNLTLPPAEEFGIAEWAYASFEAPAELMIDETYWVVMKGIRGKARVGLQQTPSGYLRTALVNRGGQLWKHLDRRSAAHRELVGSVAALGLVYLPEPDRQTAGVELVLSGATSLRVDPTPTVQTVTLAPPPPRAKGHAVLTLTSHARGSLTLANIIQEFAR